MDPPEVAVDERVTSLRLVGRPVGQGQVPLPVVLPRMRREVVFSSSARGCASPQSLSRTYWRASMSFRARATARSFTLYEAMCQVCDVAGSWRRTRDVSVRGYECPALSWSNDDASHGRLRTDFRQRSRDVSSDAASDRPRRCHHPRRARRATLRPARATPRRRAGRLAAGPRRLARDAAGPVHRGHARRGPLHRRRSALLDGAGRRAEHAVARWPGTPPTPRPVRGGVPQARSGRAVHGTGRGSRPIAGRVARTPWRRRDPPRSGGSAGGRGRRCRARADRHRACGGPGLVRRDRCRRRSRLGRRRDRPPGGGRGPDAGAACLGHDRATGAASSPRPPPRSPRPRSSRTRRS